MQHHNNAATRFFFSFSNFEYKLSQINNQKEEVIDETYRKEMQDELIKTLKLLTISKKCISQSLEEMLSNPHQQNDVECCDRCNHCFVCKDLIIGRKFDKNALIDLLFYIFVYSDIEKPKLTSETVIKFIRSNKKHCKSIYNVTNIKVSDIESTLMVLVAAGLIGWSIKNKDNGKQFVALNLPREGRFIKIQDDDAWKAVPDRYLR